MSIRIALQEAPEFYTNLDLVKGSVVLTLSRPEQVGAIIVKLEGESRTALAVPTGGPGADPVGMSPMGGTTGPAYRPRPIPGGYPGTGGASGSGGSGGIVHENHKMLYKVAQVFPAADAQQHRPLGPPALPVVLQPGHYEFPFVFRMPINNACSDREAMGRIGGLTGAGGFPASGSGLLGLVGSLGGGGIRVMDGSKQLMYRHVTRTLPPSFTGFPRQAEIRYFVKVTLQRPGLFRENWRYQLGFKFLPIEPPRPAPVDGREAFARRPFTFQPKSPAPTEWRRKSSSFFARGPSGSGSALTAAGPSGPGAGDGGPQAAPPSVELSARLPHPPILTCNQPIPLRIVARKLTATREVAYLTSLQLDLVGNTTVRCQDLVNTEITRWVVVSRTGLAVPVSDPDAAPGAELVLPATAWSDVALPNTVMPSFATCNLSRSYALELKVGLTWGQPPSSAASSSLSSRWKKAKAPAPGPNDLPLPQLNLPLKFAAVQVYSGMAPPPTLLDAVSARQPGRPRPQSADGPASSSLSPSAPDLPPRPSITGVGVQQQQQQQPAPPYDEAPPSYDEAMAAEMTGPVFPASQARPAYSGVTNENGPATISEKN